MVGRDRSYRIEEDRWVADLRAGGVKAAHPDDGWVDRKRDRVHLCYPQFDDGVEIGDTIALGSPGGVTRLVHVVAVEPNPFAVGADRDRWYLNFEGVS
jgi:hypothetical protein